MKDRKLATRYARALLDALPDDREAELADQFLDALSRAMDDSDELRSLMHDPAVSRQAREAVLVGLAERHGAPAQVANFLRVVVDHNRTPALASMATVFREEREAAAGIVPAVMTTAAPLDAAQQERARIALERATGKRVRLTTTTDPGLLGGAVTRVGSTLYDGSLRAQLGRLRNKMMQE